MAPWLIAVIAIVGVVVILAVSAFLYGFVHSRGSRRGLRVTQLATPRAITVAPGEGGVAAPLTTGISGMTLVERETAAPVTASTSSMARAERETAAPVTTSTSSMARAERATAAPMTASTSSLAPAERATAAPVASRISSVAPDERKAPSAVMPTPEVAKEVVITREKEVYKEGPMDGNYVARDEDEAKLIQTWRPDCSLIIPPDYDEAIEIITECPLTCPYRAVSITFTELDQDELRKRPK